MICIIVFMYAQVTTLFLVQLFVLYFYALSRSILHWLELLVFPYCGSNVTVSIKIFNMILSFHSDMPHSTVVTAFHTVLSYYKEFHIKNPWLL